MKKVLHIGAVTLPVAVVCLLFFCTDFKNNNPATTSYQGNYSLELSWEPPSDSVKEVFKEYKIACVHGRDTFSSYTVDSLASSMAIESTRRGAVDTLVIHFTRPVKDTILLIEGVRPNNETVGDTIRAKVANPYFIAPNASAVVMGDIIIVSVARSDNNQITQKLWVSWRVNGDSSVAKPLGPYSFTPKQQRTQKITAKLQDSTGRGFFLDTQFVAVVGGYKQILDSVSLFAVKLGYPLTLSITQTDLDSSRFRVFVISGNGVWRDTSAFYDFKGSDTITLKRAVIDTNPQIDTVYTMDSSGLKSNPKVVFAPVIYTLPVDSFASDSLIVSVNDSTPITLAPQSTGAKFIWVLDSNVQKADTTASPTFVLYLTDVAQHVLKVTGVDQYGYAGTPASIHVHAQQFAYAVLPVVFPTQVKINTWTTWTVSVNDTASARRNNARFHWRITPANYDSIRITGADSGTLRLHWDSVAVAAISVMAIDNSKDSSAWYFPPGNIFVRRFAPSIKITNPRPMSVKTTEAIKVTASAIDSNIDGTVTSSTIQKVLWQRAGKAPAKDSTNDTVWQITSINPDTFEVYVWARDTGGTLSQPDSIQIMVKAYRPYILPLMKNDTVFLNFPALFTAFGNVSDSTAKIAEYLWSFGGNGTWTDSSTTNTITHSFSTSGRTTVIVKCRDNKNQESVPDTFYVTVNIEPPARPVMKPDTVWIDDDTLYTITSQAMNPGARLSQFVVQWVAGGQWETDTTATMRHAYTSAGSKQITFYVKDNNGTSSDTVSKTVIVRLGTPTIMSISADTALTKIFINDTIRFTVFGYDTNGQIDSMKVAWNGDTNFNVVNKNIQGNMSVFKNVFATSGTKQIRFRVYDDDGLSADTVIAITVRLGKPVIASIATDISMAQIFVDQPIKFTVNGQDTNGSIVGAKVSWNNDTTAFSAMAMANGVGTLQNTFTLSQAGTKKILFRVIDNDGLSTDSVLTVSVHTGRPVVMSITPDSIIFINDARKFTIAAFDSNGTVDSVKIDNGSGTFGLFLKTSNGSYLLNDTFARSQAGNRTIRVIAKDNDGLLSDTAKLAVTVRLAAPVMDRIAIDTTGNNLFVRDNRKYSVSAHDTNGFVRKIYFNWDGGTGPLPILSTR